jgi:2-iminobutanoate/2-iminopropanoate deaminase
VTKPTRRELKVPGLPPALSHYTDVVTVGGLAFISGCISVDPEGVLVGKGDVVAQTRQIHEYIAAALEAVGSSFGDIVKVTVYLMDVADRQAVNSVREEFFGDHRPASTLVQISALAVSGALVEIEAVAAVPS